VSAPTNSTSSVERSPAGPKRIGVSQKKRYAGLPAADNPPKHGQVRVSVGQRLDDVVKQCWFTRNSLEVRELRSIVIIEVEHFVVFSVFYDEIEWRAL
jgi:hypothetical protein